MFCLSATEADVLRQAGNTLTGPVDGALHPYPSNAIFAAIVAFSAEPIDRALTGNFAFSRAALVRLEEGTYRNRFAINSRH